MFEKTIEEIIKKDQVLNKIFLGCLARDEIPSKIISYPSCFIMNTQKRSNTGEHWLALFYDTNKIAYFFDSYGMPPSFYRLESYIKSTSSSHSKYNTRRLQGSSELCGLYCILFLYYISRNRLDDFYSKFSSKDYNKNDQYLIDQLLNYYYNKN
jgi:hypothetical protein